MRVLDGHVRGVTSVECVVSCPFIYFLPFILLLEGCVCVLNETEYFFPFFFLVGRDMLDTC